MNNDVQGKPLHFEVESQRGGEVADDKAAPRVRLAFGDYAGPEGEFPTYESLVAYVDDTLSDEDRALIQDVVGTDASLAAEVAELKAIRAEMEMYGEVGLLPEGREGLLSRLSQLFASSPGRSAEVFAYDFESPRAHRWRRAVRIGVLVIAAAIIASLVLILLKVI